MDNCLKSFVKLEKNEVNSSIDNEDILVKLIVPTHKLWVTSYFPCLYYDGRLVTAIITDVESAKVARNTNLLGYHYSQVLDNHNYRVTASTFKKFLIINNY